MPDHRTIQNCTFRGVVSAPAGLYDLNRATHFLPQLAARALLVLILFGLGSSPLRAQSPYSFDRGREIGLLGGSLLGMGAGELLRSEIDPLPLSSIPEFDDFAVDEIDFVFGKFRADRLSNYTMYVGAGAVALLLPAKGPRRDAAKIGLLLTETLLVNQALTNMTKSAFRRPRPYVYDPTWAADRLVQSGDRSSLISGHTSATAAGSFMLARVFSDYHPDSKLKPYVWAAAATLPALTGYLRVRAAKHYPSDVLAGYALGAGVGYLIPLIHRKKEGPWTVDAGATGFSLACTLK